MTRPTLGEDPWYSDISSYFDSLESADTSNAANLAEHVADTSNPHAVTKAQVGLGNVDNTADTAKPVSTATQTALNLKANTASLAAVALSGSATDITTGTLPSSVLPPIAPVSTTILVASQAAMLASGASASTVAIRTDFSPAKEYYLTATPASTLANWTEVSLAGIVTVNGHSGTSVSVVKADVGLGSVDNTSDAAKPLSTAATTALAAKADAAATTTALAAKAPLASPAFTGSPTTTTPTTTTGVATKGYVDAKAVAGTNITKGSNTSYTTTTLTADTPLVVAVPANSRVDIDFLFAFTGDVNDDIKLDFTGPAGASVMGWMSGHSTTVTGYQGGRAEYTVDDLTSNYSFGALGATTPNNVRGSITVATGSTAGNIQFRFAKNTNTTGTATIVLANSNIRAVQIS